MISLYDEGKFNPTHIMVSLSGNDICEINDDYYKRLRFSSIWHLIIDVPN